MTVQKDLDGSQISISNMADYGKCAEAQHAVDSMKNCRILIVEDHQDLAETMIDFLETMGAIVSYAADGSSGLHLACSERFDVIVLDINLPGIDGIEVCTQFREHHEGLIPVLMVSALDEPSDMRAGFHAGADDYLVKPFGLHELVARLHALILRQCDLVVANDL